MTSTETTLAEIRLAAMQEEDLPYHNFQEQEEVQPSCWQRFTSWLCSSKKPAEVNKVEAVRQNIESSSCSPVCSERTELCCKKFTNLLSWPVRKAHTQVGSSLLSIASLTTVVAATILQIQPLQVIGGLLFGYFGQTVASHISDHVNNSAVESRAAKKTVQLITRFQQHTSLATMMVTGYFALNPWAQLTNCALAGMSLCLKLKKQDDIIDVKRILRAQGVDFEPNEDAIRVVGRLERIQAIMSAHIPHIITLAGAVSFVAGLSSMVVKGEVYGPRVLSASVLAAEYGLKFLSAACGFLIERYLDHNQQSPVYEKLAKLLTKLESIAIGLSLFGHGNYKTNVQALFTILPIGFFLGSSVSKMLVVNDMEKAILHMNGDLGVTGLECRFSHVASNIVMTALFEGIGIYFLSNEKEDTVGYDVFFMLTPAIYYLTRYLFSKQQAELSSVQRFGHFLLHKSPQVISEELNYGLSFAYAGCVRRTDQNARIYFVFQALLMGATEGALFTIDAEEDKDLLEGVPEALIEDRTIEKKKLLNKIRKLNTANYSRMDILMNLMVHVFRNLKF
jgi:hypothetical protein